METIGKRLATARENAGYRSAREAAETLQWTYSTYASHENGARIPKIHTVRKYARAFGVNASWLMTGEPKDAKEAVPFEPRDRIGAVPVTGEVQAGHWVEEESFSFHDNSYVPMSPDPQYPPDAQMAFLVRGNSMNRVVQDGDYVIAVRTGHSRDAVENDIVVVRRRIGELAETSLKRLRFVDGAWQLFPDSTDPKFQKPVYLGSIENGDSVEIIARVIGSYRPLE
ncbi:LexA family protein [Hoeflea alexandrii]|uniref:Helix-turn-helix domain-containing protein n=1 Tax=Hoeflea alexandrii TaxID=288436 RepID=A0ABT1CMB9_9HYPH|nr:helix-turn-helix domain-containing protein [Hoeflea alexandrii]MCO6407320.1 helix-turn-helix domain-containing protein [Hoeflea alexandrii]MCY0154283.1 helix-turn-helix domain-containing protein [Hoeflea alexandrii]